MDESEFNSYHINKKLKDIFADITYYLKKAEKITDELKEAFSFKTFKEHFMVHQKFNLKRKLMTIFGHLALPTLIN